MLTEPRPESEPENFGLFGAMMKTEILYIDMDNVLVDFPSAFQETKQRNT